ncbi:heavy metal translocating P-type ATPase [Halomonas sp. HL-93]|uniref:heavy metal translocating P-type ATPase n=1 Tax=Halomonas sp. HL-93 TaxID=1666906 RepID=UPI0006DA5890|nr:heavy metal translocating P-type ATPase [Halomonas sp. HL-93]KPQ21363.1 MAG: Cd2+/Zn2+-exporting ATPase ZntA [Halomonas sp. HL-93]SBR46707.1 Cd2+/Zn2+-exporting ATPase [Halomonas sp. HL-93]
MTTRQQDTRDTARLNVQGMDCGGCERKVESALEGLSQVEQVSASSMSGTVSVTGYVGQALDHDALSRTLAKIGYPVVDASPTASSTPPWWGSAKGRLVLVSGALLVIAWLLAWRLPEVGAWPFILATLVGWVPIGQAAWRALRMGNPLTIEMLMTIAALGALAIGAAAEAAVVVFLFAVGELLEGVAAGQARRRIAALANLAPSTARLLEGDAIRDVPADALTPGQRVLVRPGDRVPCDGRIVTGASHLDESPINGESVPRQRAVGEDIWAGTVNLDAALEVEVTRGAADNTIARIIHLVEEAQAAKAPVARFIDRFARWYMPLVVGVALLVAVVPPWLTGLAWSESVYRALALLLIACPCALVISTPAAIAAGLSTAARRGLLIKGGAVLEQLGKLQRVAVDKTGTLTAGAPSVTDVEGWDEPSEQEIVRLAAALEQDSNHPVAKAIVQHAQKLGLSLGRASESQAQAGQGVSGQFEGRELTLVSPRHWRGTQSQQACIAALEAQGKTVVLLLDGECALGVVALRDEPREDTPAAIAALNRLGVSVVMLSGDNARTVAAMGEQLGIDAEGELMPEDKAQRVRDWQAQGLGPVGKVGDGINDAPALAAADVGIAMGGGTDVALETADAALLKNRVMGVAELIALSRATLRNVKTNVALALGFKALFLVSTVLGITGMWVAVMADTGATVLVTLNAMRLLGYRFRSPVLGNGR